LDDDEEMKMQDLKLYDSIMVKLEDNVQGEQGLQNSQCSQTLQLELNTEELK
jgi:hypothetical protein